MKQIIQSAVAALLLMASISALAAGEEVKIPGSRKNETITAFWEAKDGAVGTMLLMIGGEGSYGEIVNGRPNSVEFLTRNVQNFLDGGYNVLVFGKASDGSTYGTFERSGSKHVDDMNSAVGYIKGKSSLPIYLVGWSVGAVSAMAEAVSNHDPVIAGLVLAGSITGSNMSGNVISQDGDKVVVPTLVIHHASDNCMVSNPTDIQVMPKHLNNAPFKKLVMVQGGGADAGFRCNALSAHGFNGQDKEVTGLMMDWLKHPTN